MRLFHCRQCRSRFAAATGHRTRRCPNCRRRLAAIWMPEPPRAAPGTYAETASTYASLDDFATADPRRLTSREVDFGLSWHDPATGATYRAAWVEATGELYVVQAGDPQTGGGHVEVLAVTDRATVESALEGRPERPSLAWIRRRVARMPRLTPSVRGAAALGATLLALTGPAATAQQHVTRPEAAPPTEERG